MIRSHVSVDHGQRYGRLHFRCSCRLGSLLTPTFMSVSESRVPMRPVWDALQLGLAVHGRWNLNGMPGPNKSAVETVALFSPSWFSHPGAIEMCSKLLESPFLTLHRLKYQQWSACRPRRCGHDIPGIRLLELLCPSCPCVTSP